VASRSRKPTPRATRRLTRAPATDASFLPTLEQFVADDGQISIGTVGPISCAAIANDEHNMLAALIRRPDETLKQLLERLDRAVQLAWEHDIFTDEINTPNNASMTKPRR